MQAWLWRYVEWSIRRALPADAAGPVLGDLAEDLTRHRATSGALRSTLWLLGEVRSLTRSYRVQQSSRTHGLHLWAAATRELHHAVRSLRHAPGYSLAVIGVLALGMTLATTVFAVVDGVLFKPLPYPRSAELMSIQAGFRGVQGPSGMRPFVSVNDITAWRRAMPDVRFTLFRTSRSARFEETNDAPLGVAEIERDFFDVIGVRPLLGGFSPDHFEEQSNVGATIISYQLWQSRFGGAPDIVGRRIVRGTAAMDIVGVMPPSFVFPARQNAQVLMPLRFTEKDRTDPRMRAFEALARIPSAATAETTRERIEATMGIVARDFPPLPPLPPGRRWANPQTQGPFDQAAVQPLNQWLSSRPRSLFFAVFAAAAALVLLGCVNVSGLMAARSLDRRHEIGLRRALGAGAGHIATLVLAEAGVLAATGTLLGLALTIPALRIAHGLLPIELALLKVPTIDLRVVLFAAAVTMISVAGISVWPIRRGLRAAGMETLAGASRSVVRVRSAGRSVVVSAQIAIGLTLTLAGGLLVGSIVRLQADDIGIETRDVFAVEVRVPATSADTRPGGAEGVVTRVLNGVRTIPGVSAAGATDAPLLRNLMWGDDGWKVPPGGKSAGLYYNVHGITSGFFDVVRPRLLAGRLPSREELDAGRLVVVVSESIAKAFWPERSAVGAILEYDPDGKRLAQFLVVGVVADARFTAWDDDRFRQIYAPTTALRRGSGSPSILIRTEHGGRVLGAMEPFMRAEGADVRAIRAMALRTMFAETVRPRRFQSWLFGSFAAAALAIVGAGILGLTAMTAARRTREIGLRVALGATKQTVLRLFVREQLVAVTIGLAIGGIVSAWAMKFLQTYLYRLTFHDPRVWLLAVLLVAGTAAAGALIPALRATRIDPAVALRSE